MTTFRATTSSFLQGARTLPREYYTDPALLAEEGDRIFARSWNCVGRSSMVARPGDYVLCDLAGESLILVRARDGQLRAFFNICRHRGTRILLEPAGRLSETIQCIYHAWTWTTEGRLIGTPHMQEAEDFDKKDYPLHQAAVAEWEGFVFLNIAEDPVPFGEIWAPMLGRLERFGLPGLKVGRRVVYDVAANWKLVKQNYSECLHCPTIHPELGQRLPYQSGANDLVEGPFLGGYMEITEGSESATASGRRCGLPISDRLPAHDARRAYYYSLMPNMMLSIHPDYVNYYMVTPVAVDRTRVVSEWMFNPANEGRPEFNPEDAVQMWDVTNRQDWDICERSQLGVASRRYRPGPYSPRESIPAAWDREYLRQMGRD